jgi:hypothetical protein
MPYYNYHATAKRLIASGDIIGYKYLDKYNGIAPCLMLYFNSHRPMPIREYRWSEYKKLLEITPVRAERN